MTLIDQFKALSEKEKIEFVNLLIDVVNETDKKSYDKTDHSGESTIFCKIKKLDTE